MKDAFGEELEVGDKVIEVWVTGSKVGKRKETITRFTAKRVALSNGYACSVPHNLIKIGALHE